MSIFMRLLPQKEIAEMVANCNPAMSPKTGFFMTTENRWAFICPRCRSGAFNITGDGTESCSCGEPIPEIYPDEF